ncbi:hypothetical protein LWI28_005530 [Acer negundo]|uniref:Uncharacterized protein n=1 Tax=Acer negundo TaxID=4023 RepID=A0AAD5IY69_ACENE|nr:hypothetical protein LWI28_005530 [Acer negundo]
MLHCLEESNATKGGQFAQQKKRRGSRKEGTFGTHTMKTRNKKIGGDLSWNLEAELAKAIERQYSKRGLSLVGETQAPPHPMKRNANKKALVGRKGKKNAGETSDFTEVQVEYKPAVGVIELDPLEDPECNFLTRGMHSKRGKLLVTHPSSSAKFLK